MASLDISQLRNVSSDVIRNAEHLNSKVYNVLGPQDDNNSFANIFGRAMENKNICQMLKMRRLSGLLVRLTTLMIFPLRFKKHRQLCNIL